MPTASVAIAHISDLHFAGQVSPPRGQPGHAPVLCRALLQALRDIAQWAGVQTSDNVHLVVTGDVSDSGIRAEFTTANAFFGAGWPLGPSLNRTNQNLYCVPGNRDHSGPRGIAAAPLHLLPSTPWRENLSPHGPLSVELYGVDSMSGHPPAGTPGEISDPHFDALDVLLAGASLRPGAQRVRILLCHHTLLSSTHGRSIGALSLGGSSRRRLLELAADRGIRVLLTGHAHDPLTHQHSARRSNGTRTTIVEFRSPTTLVDPAVAGRHGLWGYRILLEASGELWWESRLYHWDGSSFCPIRSSSSPTTWYRRFRLR